MPKPPTRITAQDIGVPAMIEKLTRIWVPEGTPRENIHAKMDGTWHRELVDRLMAEREAGRREIAAQWDKPYREDEYTRMRKKDRSSYLVFSVERLDQTCFTYRERSYWWDLCSTEPFPSDDEEPGYKFYGTMGLLRIWDYDERGEFYDPGQHPCPEKPYSSAKQAAFSARWLPYFRRNCWLCSCDMESTREERQGWVQGLTPQEIEAWQLKI